MFLHRSTNTSVRRLQNPVAARFFVTDDLNTSINVHEHKLQRPKPKITAGDKRSLDSATKVWLHKRNILLKKRKEKDDIAFDEQNVLCDFSAILLLSELVDNCSVLVFPKFIYTFLNI